VAEDPYVYPGTSVLKNIPGIRDAAELKAFEARATGARILELDKRPIVGKFDRAHLQAIHKQIFQDVYPWAGKTREGAEIAKPGSPFFAFSQYIVPSLDKVAAQLKSEDQLRSLSADTFSIRAGHYLGELNAIHPFREGNGRTQQEFVRELALQAGHTLEWTRITREQMYSTSKLSFERGDSSELAAIVNIAIVQPTPERSVFVGQALDAMRAAKTTILTSAIAEQPTRTGSVLSGRVIAIDDRYVALATGSRSFAVLERAKLSAPVSVGDQVKARVGAAQIAIESRAHGHGHGRER